MAATAGPVPFRMPGLGGVPGCGRVGAPFLVGDVLAACLDELRERALELRLAGVEPVQHVECLLALLLLADGPVGQLIAAGELLADGGRPFLVTGIPSSRAPARQLRGQPSSGEIPGRSCPRVAHCPRDQPGNLTPAILRCMDTADSEGSAARVIITGGAGFLGTLLARRLLAGPAGSAGPPRRTWASW